MKLSPNKWLTCFKPKPHAMFNLVCFPFGGAGASVYKSWVEELPDTVQLWAVQLPGRENRFSENFVADPEFLAKKVVDDLVAMSLDNLVVFGHSMGSDFAVLATEEIAARGMSMPKLLVVSGNKPPCVATQKKWGQVEDSALLDHVIGLGAIPAEVVNNKDFLDMYLVKIRADYLLYEANIMRSPIAFNVPVLVVYGEDDPLLQGIDMQQWNPYSLIKTEVVSLIGEHFYFQPNNRALISEIITHVL